MSNMATRASVDLLQSLHSAVAQELLERVKSGEAKPADISNAIKFLKDNGIEQLLVDDNDIGKLLQGLPFQQLIDSASEQH